MGALDVILRLLQAGDEIIAGQGGLGLAIKYVSQLKDVWQAMTSTVVPIVY